MHRFTTLTLILTLLCSVLYTYWYSRRGVSRPVTMQRVLDEAKTGDLILFRWGTRGPVESSVSYFSHVGMILEGKLVEAHARGDTEHLGNPEGGIFAYDIAERLGTYEGSVYWAPLVHPLSRQTIRRLQTTVEDLSDTPFDHGYPEWYIGGCMLGLGLEKNKGLFCSEFMARVLQGAGLIRSTVNASCQTPDAIATNHGLYMKPHLIDRI